MSEYTIKNEYLTVRISSMGAELQSIVDNLGNERLWYGDEKFWGGRAPILFPVCGGLMNDSYIFNGKKYSMPKHGFAKTSEFVLETAHPSACTYLLHSNNETRAIYPFEFELRITYTLKQMKLRVDYSVKNLSDETMYFSIGAHEAYLCEGGIQDYYIEFEQNETLDTYDFDGSYPNGNRRRIITDSKTFPLEYKYFMDDTLMFDKMKSKSASIVHKSGKTIAMAEFGEFEYLLFWTVDGAPYICIEPWSGIPDRVDSDMNFAAKESNTELFSGAEYKISHSLEFFE